MLLLLVVAIVLIIKMTELKHKFLFYILLGLGIVVVVSLVYIFFKTDADILTYEGFLDFGRSYYSWLANAFGNMGGITNYAVQQDWTNNATAVSS